MVRLARRGFTLGELGLVAQGATALFIESVNLTIARVSNIFHLTYAPLMNYLSDFTAFNPIHQNIPTSNTTPHLSNRTNSRRIPYWFPALPTPSTLPQHLSKTLAPTALRNNKRIS